MMNKKRTALVGFVAAMLMALTGLCPCQACAAFAPDSPLSWTETAKNPVVPDSIYPHTLHDDISAAGVSYSGYDETKVNTVLQELEKYTKASPSGSPIYDAQTAVPLLLDSLLAETDTLFTQYELRNLDYYRDVNNDAISDEISKIYEDYVATADRALRVLRDISKGPNGKILKKELTKNQIAFLEDYKDMTKREKRLLKEEDALVQEYDKLILNSKDYEKDNKAFARIYSKLVNIRNELATIHDYENYPDYSYEMVYYRDYSCDDAKSLYADVKKYMVPLFVESCQAFYNLDYFSLLSVHDSGDEILGNIAPYIDDIDPALKSAFNYLRRHHTYDLDDSPTKMDIGYTVDLSEYGALYIFNKPYNEAADYSVIIHEFGHYNAGFHNRQHSLFTEQGSFDIAEIQSQGLELLFLDYYDELFGDITDITKKETIINILTGVVTGCMYDEFQQTIYDHPNMTRKEINALSADLAEEYGMIDAGYMTKESAPYDWVEISHTFESPMYYISYATSALSSLDILTESLDDRDAAVKKYMDVTAVKSDVPYLKGLKKCGLRNVFETKTVKDIAEKIRSYN